MTAPRRGGKVRGLTPAISQPLSKCSACGAAIIWAVTDRGRKMPIDASPALPGVGDQVLYFYLDAFGNLFDSVQRVMTADDELRKLGGDIWISHFATCPDAKKFRRREGSQP